MALYTFTSQDDFAKLNRLPMPTPDQTQLYNALGRGAGAQDSQGGGFDPLGFLKKKGSSIENAISSTVAAPVSFVKDSIQNASMDKLMSDNKNKMNDIYKKHGYENSDAYYDAKNANENNVFSKYGFNADDFWNKRAEADLRGDKDTIARLEQERADIINRMSAEDADSIRRFDSIQDELKGQASNNSAAVKKSADEYKDWVDNNYLSNKLKQDRGKYLGSAINTLSTATDLLGLTSGPVSNAIQGGIEGIADELEQNGLDNFSWERAGQNALSGAASGAAAGALNSKLDSVLGGMGRKATQGAVGGIRGAMKNFGDSAIGSTMKNVGKGVARGAASGAVGGGVGAGVSAALNGQDVLGSAIEGAKQGLLGGATAGGIMTGVNAALNNTPGVGRVLQEANQAASDFRNKYESGDGNRLNRFVTAVSETADSGNSPVVNMARNIGNGIDDLRTRAVNKNAINRLADGIETGADGTVKFARMSKDLLDDINAVRLAEGKNPLTERQTNATIKSMNNHLAKHIDEFGSYEDIARAAFNTLTGDASTAVPAKLTNSMILDNSEGPASSVVLDETSNIRSISPRSKNQTKNYIQERDAILNSSLEGGNSPSSQLVDPESGLPISSSQTTDTILPQKNSGVNGANDLTSVFEPNNANIITQRNKLQSIGEQLKNASKTQKYGALYDSLDAKTASRAVKTGAPEALSKLGVRPENYLESAKTSNYINKVVTDLAEKSGVKVNAPTLATDLSADNLDVLMSDTAAKKYDSYIKKIIPDGTTPDEYSAGYLLKKSRELGEKAANLRGNTDDVYSLRQALTDAKYKLRDIATNALEKAEITGDLTNDNVAKGLAKIGANEKIQDYYTEAVDGKAPSISDYIRRSSLFEQARDMGNQIEAEKYTRSASKVATNPITKVWNASGLDEPVNAVLKNTVAPIAGGITRLAGGIVEGAGNAIAKAKGSISNNGGTSVVRTSMSEPKVPVAPSAQTQIYDLIGRNEGLSNAEQARTANYLTEAVQETQQPTTQTLEQLVAPNSGVPNGSNSVYNSVMATPNANMTSANSGATNTGYFPQTGDYWTDILGSAMSAAIDADDVNAFAALYGMYQSQIANLSKSNGKDYSDIKNWNSSDRSRYLDAQDGLSQIDMLERAYTDAVGADGGNWLQGTLRGMASSVFGGNLDPSAANYNKQAESIGMGIVKNMISLGVTEADAKRYLDYLPSLTDTKEQAAKKLETLRDAYQRQINNLRSVYN